VTLDAYAAAAHADREIGERCAIPVRGAVGVHCIAIGIAMEGEGAARLGADHGGVAPGADQAAAGLGMDLARQAVGPGRHEDGAVRIERRLEGRRVVGRPVTDRTVVLDRHGLVEPVADPSRGAAIGPLVGQRGDRRASGEMRGTARDENEIVRRERSGVG
jgi:hypothetical protein